MVFDALVSGVDLEVIMLSEVSQTEKDKHCRIFRSKVESKKAELIKIENRMVVLRGWGWEKRREVKGTNLQLVDT